MENRRHVRIPLHKVGAISVGPELPKITCSVTDISDGGAALKVMTTFGIPRKFELTIEGEPGKRYCNVAWTDAHRLGVAFQ